MRQLIVVADDFGVSPAVNAAVVAAHRHGILTAASLLVNETASAEAVALAHANPTLAVGLHLALSLSRATLPAAHIPHLVDAEGRFPASSAWAGLRYQFSRATRRELADEIRAQLARFRATGLVLDHVTGHQHVHMHPQVLTILLDCAGEYGIAAFRVVRDDLGQNLRLDRARLGYKLSHWAMFGPLGRHAARRVHTAGLAMADRVRGLYQDGRMTTAHLRALLRDLPVGVTEIYAHPSTAPDGDPQRLPQEELAALTDAGVRALVATRGIALTSYTALAAGNRTPTPADATGATPSGED
jgi:hopanoid biosynthesis associated protein HpnK